MTPFPARSYLFVPGTKPDLFPKALASGADVVILDLEDAVGESSKDAARANVESLLTAARPVVVRINSMRTRWATADLALCRHAKVAAVILPKVETPAEVRDARSELLPTTKILPMIESAQSLRQSETIAAEDGVQRLIFGALDFQADLNIPSDDGLTVFRSHLVLASRLAGIESPVDGITRQFQNTDAVQADTARARALGFGGKLCIHPRQIAPVNEGFSPTVEEVAWAQRVVAADDAAAGGVTSVDDGMIDKPVTLRARAILAASSRR